jgi:hypothetical protein
MKTAVEWLIQELIPNAMQMFDAKTCNAIEKAKEMERRQSISILTKYHNSLFLLPLKRNKAKSIYNHIVGVNKMITKQQEQ